MTIKMVYSIVLINQKQSYKVKFYSLHLSLTQVCTVYKLLPGSVICKKKMLYYLYLISGINSYRASPIDLSGILKVDTDLRCSQ